ncbi:hypothetical protein PR202_gb03058 [Eleusine coracana subsp. coracana]|uniref:AP2/ERF domain-containing protein n=1 Tax=Eleusine coracana subsp. coracana TaxID=191504 RepID=A0AAV5DZF1_ELECO|nr:hypothetical protein PR202_gb03058 [Eleusine coracana subsp. coracana]
MARPRKNAATASDNSSTAGAVVKPKPTPKPKPKRARKSAPPECRPSSRSSAFRGVTRHRWTGRFEAHLWDKDTWNHESQTRKKKGKQGAYDDEEAAARAYDLAALKYWGPGTVLNFPLCSYDEELKEMEGQSREEYIGSVRRKSSGFSRGVSKYRGVASGLFCSISMGSDFQLSSTTQEEAAVAYDIAAIEHRGLNAVTNFDISHYVNWHRRRLDATAETIPVQLPNDEEHAHATIGSDEIAAFHDGEHQYHIADSYIVQLPDDDQVMMMTPVREAPPSSALDLLLRSPKFKEMMEQVTAAAAAATATESDNTSSSSSSFSPSSLSQQSPEPQPESSGGASSAPPCSFFPEDVQTHFECDDDGGMSFAFAEVDTFLFGDLGSYAAPMFQCDQDVFV